MQTQELLKAAQPYVAYAVTLLVGAVLRELPRVSAWIFGTAEEYALIKGGPTLDGLVLAGVKLAEKAIPASGAGERKYKFVADFITKGLPPEIKIDPDALDDSIEKAVAAMKAEADKIQQQHDSQEPPK